MLWNLRSIQRLQVQLPLSKPLAVASVTVRSNVNCMAVMESILQQATYCETRREMAMAPLDSVHRIARPGP